MPCPSSRETEAQRSSDAVMENAQHAHIRRQPHHPSQDSQHPSSRSSRGTDRAARSCIGRRTAILSTSRSVPTRRGGRGCSDHRHDRSGRLAQDTILGSPASPRQLGRVCVSAIGTLNPLDTWGQRAVALPLAIAALIVATSHLQPHAGELPRPGVMRRHRHAHLAAALEVVAGSASCFAVDAVLSRERKARPIPRGARPAGIQ